MNESNRDCQAELERLKGELEKLQYAVSHDLRAPLRSIQGFSRLLLDRHQQNLDATAQDYLQRIVRAGARMGEQIEALLLLSRIGRDALQTQTVDLTRLAQQGLQALATEQAVEVEWSLDTLPPVQADARLLQMAWVQLLENAIKFSSLPGKACRIRISACLGDGAAQLSVRDYGTGFDMLYADKLFVPFQRLHAEDEYPGLGVGLAIAAKIIERHGGRMHVEAEPGVGAVFGFSVPLPIAE